MYVNLAELKRDRHSHHELLLATPEIINVIIHQEEPDQPELYYNQQLSGEESPPLGCNQSLISTEPRHTM